MQDALNPVPPILLVIVDEVLVATDIQMMIADLRPDARVIVARNVAEAIGLVPKDGRIDYAFVQSDRPTFQSSILGRRLVDQGGHLVLVGAENGDMPDGALVLQFPFAQSDVARLLQRERLKAIASRRAARGLSSCDA
jgi:hypothetical protein